MSDPFLMAGPASISFSGGRTSAYMLWRILQAHGGTLPDDVVVTFANTGREREETLRFVHECGARWGVRIAWLEWRREAPGFEAAARVRKPDVMAFWHAQPFDLGLASHEGNCDLCFLKGKRLRQRIIRDDPGAASWWLRMEAETSGFFDRRDRVSDLVEAVRRSPELFDQLEEIEERDAECGDLCGGDSLAELMALQRIYEATREALS